MSRNRGKLQIGAQYFRNIYQYILIDLLNKIMAFDWSFNGYFPWFSLHAKETRKNVWSEWYGAPHAKPQYAAPQCSNSPTNNEHW